jgi:hypothetical protein
MFIKLESLGGKHRSYCMSIMVIIILSSLTSLCGLSLCDQENDLCLLVSSYEDDSISVNDLAAFLAAHGFNAEPTNNYVTTKLSGGKNVCLVPNGAESGLADLWMSPPSNPSKISGHGNSEPRLTIKADVIKKNVNYIKSNDEGFIDTIKKSVYFPVEPLGMCFDGAQQVAKAYKGLGYNVYYLYCPASATFQGHIWITIEDPSDKNTWLAVDSYYGPTTDDDRYYHAEYSFSDIKYLDLVKPCYKVSLC